MLQDIQHLLVRDLKKLRLEITLYKDEAAIWRSGKHISNPAGNLCLHLVGNLKTYIGAVLGKTGYQRQRDLEFAAKDVPVADLVKMIDETILVIESTFRKLDEQQLHELYPVMVFEEPMTTRYFLLHLAMHLGYHLGQVNYHRRLFDD